MINLWGHNLTLRQIQWLGWSCVFLLTLSSYYQSSEPVVWLIYCTVNLSCTILIIYANIYWLIPRFYQQGKKIAYAFFASLMVIAICIFRVQFRAFLLSSAFPDYSDPGNVIQIYLVVAVYCVLALLFSIVFYLALNYFTMRREKELLRQYTAEVELNLLKSQVQPHFLFNTLNNIYYLANREAPETAVQLAKLSNLMRYFVDQGSNREVLVETEFNFVRDYIDLERMRMRYPLQLDIQLKGEVNNVTIPPMLMIPLVENVFKHGINKRSKENSLVVHTTVMPTRLTVEVKNKLNNNHDHKKNGTGLKNLRSRLQLLYGTDFKLYTEKKDAFFTAYLQIPL